MTPKNARHVKAILGPLDDELFRVKRLAVVAYSKQRHFEALTFPQRLLWLLTGRLPQPAPPHVAGPGRRPER